MMPAAKHLDPVLGIDIHIIQPPGPVPPLPIPHPFIGIILDPFDYVPFIGATVIINGMPRAIAGTAGRAVPPHIPIGGMFVVPPGNECEMFMGSMTVSMDGDAASHMVHPVLSCQSVGMIAPFRTNPKKKTKMKSFVLPTSVVLPIPMGLPVLIGGPPIISLKVLAMKLFMKGLGKAFKKLKGKYQKFKAKKAKGKPKSSNKPDAPANKPPANANNKACGKPGEPVFVVNGANVDEFIDFTLPGLMSFTWRRYYDSSKTKTNCGLGWGYTHEYARYMETMPNGLAYINQNDEAMVFPLLEVGGRSEGQAGFSLVRVAERTYRLEEFDAATMEFTFVPGQKKAFLGRMELGNEDLGFFFNKRGQLREVHGTYGMRIYCMYDEQARISEIHYQANRDQTRYRMMSYTYDAVGNPVVWRNALGHAATCEYDGERRMIRKTDYNGYSFHYHYDETGRVIHTHGDDGLYDVRFTYVPAAGFTVATHADGSSWTYFYDPQGTITSITNPLGETIERIVDESGVVIEEHGPGALQETLLYTESGAQYGRQDGLGYISPPIGIEGDLADPLAPVRPEHALGWQLGGLIDPKQIGKPRTNDAVLNHSDFVIPRKWLSLITGSGRHAHRDLKEKPPIGPNYDALGRVLSETDGEGFTRTYSYDANSNITGLRDRDGSFYQFRISSWNLVKEALDPLGHLIRYDYNSREMLTEVVDAGGGKTEYRYDLLDRLVAVHRHGGLKESYTYDAAGNLLQKADGDGQMLLAFEVDDHGLQKARYLASGEIHRFEYDGAGRATAMVFGESECQRQYDKAGRLVGDSLDGLGITHEFGPRRLRQSQYLGKFTVRYELDRDGSRVMVDPMGRRHRFRASDSGLFMRCFEQGLRELSWYDPKGRCKLKIVSHQDKPASEWVQRFSYSPEGDLLKAEDSLLGNREYEYDVAHRLASEVIGGSFRRHYQYDASANILRKPGLNDVRVQSGNRLIAANGDHFSFNRRNHLAKRENRIGEPLTYHYDSRDLLVEIRHGGESIWQAGYDPLARRIWKKVRGREHRYYWDGERLAAEVNPTGRLRLYLYPDAIAWVPTMIVDYSSLDAKPEEGSAYFVFANHQGTPILLKDEQGRDIWAARIAPYGQAEVEPSSKIEFNLRFPGHYHDPENDLHYNRYRYYSPELGRYLQSDPIGLAGGLNVYAYTTNPLREVDLVGLHPNNGTKVESKGTKRKGSPDAEGTPNTKAQKTAPLTSASRRYGDIPAGKNAVSAQKRIDKGFTPPPHVKAKPEKYYYDKDIGKYVSRPEPKPDFSKASGREIPCFPAGTLVQTPMGAMPIESLELGNKVLAYNEDGATLDTRPVIRAMNNQTLKLVEIDLASETITATRGHRFWVESYEQWIEARFLKQGMTLRSASGEVHEIKAINHITSPEEKTYNLTVADHHTYYVGQAGVLVHNNGGDTPNGKIYIGYDPKGNPIYVGQTLQTIDKRQTQHINEGFKEPDKYKFKQDMEIRQVDGMDGLTQDQMDFHERRIYDQLEADGHKMQNRQIPMRDHKINELKAKHC